MEPTVKLDHGKGKSHEETINLCQPVLMTLSVLREV